MVLHSLVIIYMVAATNAQAPSPPVTSTQANDKAEIITLRGKRIYIAVSGRKDAPVVLYLHGGPGAGAYDFSLYQGQRLSRALRLVVMDQRGALRSDSLSENEAFGLQDLIEDCEALRKHLGVKSWSVLGHSFGGYLAILYALQYPASIENLILESPTFDLASSARSLLRAAAIEYRKLGKSAKAEECLKAARAVQSAEATWENFSLTNDLGAARNNLYVHGKDKDFFERLVARSPLPKQLWSKSGAFQAKLYAEKLVFESLVPKLSELNCPVLLLKGKYDWVTADDQVEAFRRKVRSGKVVVFERSGHFPRVEEPALYAQVVTSFVTSRTGKRRISPFAGKRHF